MKIPHIGHYPDGEQIQDNVGKLITQLLNQQYEQVKTKSTK